jgi:hypothetical protein
MTLNYVILCLMNIKLIFFDIKLLKMAPFIAL